MQSVDPRFASVTVKSLVIGGLTLLMLWPLMRVESLVNERQALQHRAYDVIAAGFGGSQILGAPILSVDTEDRSLIEDTTTKKSTISWAPGAQMHLLPDDVRITSDVAVELRSKGIYSVPVYLTKVVVTGEFKPEAIAAVLASNDDMRVLAARAVIQLPLTGVKYLRTLTHFEVGGQALHATSGEVAEFTALSSAIDLYSIDRNIPLPFRIEFAVAGSDSLHFLPLGSTTTVTTHVAWPHPDFDGAFLPISHTRTAEGYSANWQILGLNRAVPQSWRGNSVRNCALLATAFGVRLFQPSDIYTQNYRAVRYGILFIAITFACFFTWEHLVRGLRLHPMQYLLVGLALATFYLLLLALSEHIGFGFSYALAAAALVALITTYIAGATANRRAAFGIGAALTASYGALYVILLSEDNALLLGSLLLFAILAALMLATRRLDWAQIGRETRPNDP
ncbi:MAG TPA: cell envelope integrity protein CreD [Steroidobacteraceae bacterium]|nr:cell envelope integrity protein CreD [Steroidobacteraceae bacterium]